MDGERKQTEEQSGVFTWERRRVEKEKEGKEWPTYIHETLHQHLLPPDQLSMAASEPAAREHEQEEDVEAGAADSKENREQQTNGSDVGIDAAGEVYESGTNELFQAF